MTKNILLLFLGGYLFFSCQSSSIIEEYMDLVGEVYSGQNAYETTAYVSERWRTPGSTGFDSSIYYVQRILEKTGYRPWEMDSLAPLTYRMEHYPLRTPAWDPIDAKLFIAGESTPLLDFTTNRNMVAINSFSTPEDGIEAEVVFLQSCELEVVKNRDLKGKIIMADCHSYPMVKLAEEMGALGVLAYFIPDYNQPEKYTQSIPFTGIPFNSELQSWAINLSFAARQALKERLDQGPLKIRVEIETRFFPSEELTLIAEVRGTQFPEERLVYSAHVQEPGANDNASGVGAQAEMARVAAQLHQEGKILPDRTLTFLWGVEIRSTHRYINQDSLRRQGIKWGVSLDMVGEDTEQTGGTFLIEKMPDPSAIWTRGEDKHTEWGASKVDESDFNPHYFNDFVEFVCRQRALRTNWEVKTNPFEGGSDHQPFLDAEIPGILFWHFTDVYYHTDADRIDKVSAETLANVGVSALVSGLTLCTAQEKVAEEVLAIVAKAANKRLLTEGILSQTAIKEGGPPDDEAKIIQAWRDWYEAAVPTVADILPGPPGKAFQKEIKRVVHKVNKIGKAQLEGL